MQESQCMYVHGWIHGKQAGASKQTRPDKISPERVNEAVFQRCIIVTMLWEKLDQMGTTGTLNMSHMLSLTEYHKSFRNNIQIPKFPMMR